MKVKEPIESEYKLIKKDQLVFTYFHFASYEPLTTAMISSGAVCLAYEPSNDWMVVYHCSYRCRK